MLDNRASPTSLAVEKRGVELLARDFIEERMPDVFRLDAALVVPRFLERQRAEHVIDKAPHLGDAPAGPGPKLRRHEVEHRNALGVRTPRDPPVEAGVIDQDDRIGPMLAKVAIRLRNQAHDVRQAGEDLAEAHDRMIAQREQMLAPRRRHPVAAEADAFEGRIKPSQSVDQVGAVNVAAGLADAEEDAHGDILVMISLAA